MLERRRKIGRFDAAGLIPNDLIPPQGVTGIINEKEATASKGNSYICSIDGLS